MAATSYAPELSADPDLLGRMLETVLAVREPVLDPRVVAASLKIVAAWLEQQPRLPSEAYEHPGSNVRLLRAPRLTINLLSAREREVADCIARGMSNRE